MTASASQDWFRTSTAVSAVKEPQFEGSCSCGDVKLSVRLPATVDEVMQQFRTCFTEYHQETGHFPLLLGRCFCDDCCRAPGTLLACMFFVPEGCITWHDPHGRIVEYKKEQPRTHCSRCGSTLSYYDNPLKINLPVGLFLRDDDDGKTNAFISSYIVTRNYGRASEQEKLALTEVGGGLAAVIDDGVPKFLLWPSSKLTYDLKTASPVFRGPTPATVRFHCFCGEVRMEAPYPNGSFTGGHCACISCAKASGGLLFSAAQFKLCDVRLQGPIFQYESRRFCQRCGSCIAWQRPGSSNICLSLALLDDFSLFKCEAGTMPYECLADQKGLRLPTAYGRDGKDGGLSGLITDERQKKFQGPSASQSG